MSELVKYVSDFGSFNLQTTSINPTFHGTDGVWVTLPDAGVWLDADLNERVQSLWVGGFNIQGEDLSGYLIDCIWEQFGDPQLVGYRLTCLEETAFSLSGVEVLLSDADAAEEFKRTFQISC